MLLRPWSHPPVCDMNIVLLGEAWGEAEERERMAFVGPSGHELHRMCNEAGIKWNECYRTNVFNLRPAGNKVETLCGLKSEGIPGMPALVKSGYVRRQFQRELNRLADELTEVNPNIIICFGNVPSWAMLGKTYITKLRGVVQYSTHTVEGFKVLPTFHPAHILRPPTYHLRPTVIMDLIKAKRESEFPDIRRPERTLWIDPDIGDIVAFDRKYIQQAERLSVDIETVGEVVTTIGLAPSGSLGIVIPLVIPGRSKRDYWANRGGYRRAYDIVKGILERPTPPKTFQNGLYDIAFLKRALRIKVAGAEHDTMLLHHALQPEALKGLEFLGSIYTDEGPWKKMREKKTTIKRDD